MAINGLEYISSYPDLRAAFGANKAAGEAHYAAFGAREGRVVTFDALEYIASYSDLIAGFGPDRDAGAAHYITNGVGERRNTSFDALQYIASHNDLIEAFGANQDLGARHYIQYGLREGRDRDDFDAAQYLENYADLRAAFGNNREAATAHYITSGYAEGRIAEEPSDALYFAARTSATGQELWRIDGDGVVELARDTHGIAPRVRVVRGEAVPRAAIRAASLAGRGRASLVPPDIREPPARLDKLGSRPYEAVHASGASCRQRLLGAGNARSGAGPGRPSTVRVGSGPAQSYLSRRWRSGSGLLHRVNPYW